MTDPLDPLEVLGVRLTELAAQLGLDAQQFAIVVDISGHKNHMAQAMFTLTPEVIDELQAKAVADQAAADPEAEMINAELEGIMAASDAAEEEAVRDAARQREEEKMDEVRMQAMGLKERLAKGKNILDDD